jgi:phage terminase large subunit-like protein
VSSLADFRAFAGELVLDNGRRMVLEDFQTTMLADYFAGIRETVIIIPKKNAKSTTLAALAVFHLITTHDAECVIAAASRDQATLIYDMARGFVRRTPALAELVTVRRGYRELRRVGDDGRIRVLVASVDTADGALPTLALVDELHRHPSGELYEILNSGLAGRGGRMVTISTAGDNLDSPLGRLRAKAYAAPGMVRAGAHRHVRTDAFAMHEWACDDGQDLDDLEAVKAANPASWITLEDLRERHDSPSTTPWGWARFACGVWLQGENSAITPAEWEACRVEGCAIPDGARDVVIGIDLGWKWDTSAIVPVWRPPSSGPVIVGEPVIVVPPGDGSSTEQRQIWDPIKMMADRFRAPTFVIDPNAGGQAMAQRIDGELRPARVAEFTQGAPGMARAAARLSEAIANGEIQHPGHDRLTAHVLAAATVSVGEGWRFAKRKRAPAPIDGLIAMAIAFTVLGAERPSGRAVW